MLKADAQTTPGRTVATVAVVLGLAQGALLAALRATDGWNPVVVSAEGFVLDDLALAAVFGAPALLAWVALRGRPILLLSAGFTSTLVAMGSFSILALPMLVPGVLYLVAFGRMYAPSRVGRAQRAIAAVACGALVVAAATVFLVGSSHTVCWTKVTSRDGSIAWGRDSAAERFAGRSSGSIALAPGDAESEAGCNPIFPPLGSVAVLLLVGGAVGVGQKLPRQMDPA